MPNSTGADGAIARYSIQRITLTSAFKVGLTLGWVIALMPALVVAWLVTQVVARVYATVSGIQPFNITVLGQNVANIDPISILGQTNNVQTLTNLATNQAFTFIAVTLIVTIIGAILVLLCALLFCGGYNVLARLTGGFQLELKPWSASQAALPAGDPPALNAP
jgi:hypothetical protein